MKYFKEYKITNNKYEFIQLLISKYPIKPATAERRYYDVRKKAKTEELKRKPYTPKIHPDEITKPSYQRLVELEDMKRLKTKLTRENLTRYGFLEYEINWLITNNVLELEK